MTSVTEVSLFSPLRIGGCPLEHRIVMAPLTRSRAAHPGNVPTPMNAQYYGQRASSGGLIIAEATQVSPMGRGIAQSPGIHSAEQVSGWKRVTDAVHARGGRIFLQLWHAGRVSHSTRLPGAALPIAPSAVAIRGELMVSGGRRVPYETPRALTLQEIQGLVESFALAAQNARDAEFDGVEIHGANGYLLEQFLHAGTNLREDDYGGSLDNRVRFALEVAHAVAGVWGADRVGMRLSPYGVAADSSEPDPMPLYAHLIGGLRRLGLAYLHLIEPRASGVGAAEVDRAGLPSAAVLFRPMWDKVLISAGNHDAASAHAMVASGHADAIAFGRLFIANPDLPARLQRGTPLNRYDRSTFYTRGPQGYTDYPAMHA
ncbi:alkene reductase [Comamonadaceae bacterium G21597-S1]|nr:alkene reductase [Comamonadaceae bacterium G21597-S1]